MWELLQVSQEVILLLIKVIPKKILQHSKHMHIFTSLKRQTQKSI